MTMEHSNTTVSSLPYLVVCAVDFHLFLTTMADRKKQVRKLDQVTIESQLDNEVRMTLQSSFAKVNHPLASGTRNFSVKSVDYGGNPSQKGTPLCANSILFQK